MTAAPSSSPVCADVVRRRAAITGVVQGVGFRPFVYRLAGELGLRGFVGNDATGVFVEVEGASDAVDRFAVQLVTRLPPLASVTTATWSDLVPTGDEGFTIVASADASGERAAIPPDVATCPSCLAELLDPADRRYRYPFGNCTDCGPRYTIITDLPYDRPNTTMAGFELCADCAAEYADPSDRRYHAQPIACPTCGPRLRFEADGAPTLAGTDAAIGALHATLAAGGVVAVKGIGGYHLACDAADSAAVARLRERKGRADKPFAVMVADLEAVREIAQVDDDEVLALTSAAAPIVLLRRRAGSGLDHVAPGNPLIGVMLPYSPLHHLLFRPVPGGSTPAPRVLVLTSGNRSNEPICTDDAEARTRLADLADAFMVHDRPIHVPCDDSVVRVIDGVVQPVRRSRGFAPVPVALPVDVAPVLAVGGELKNTFCLASGRRAWVGPHVGDMENLETLQAFTRGVDGFRHMYAIDPAVVAVDRHPGYLTRRWALEHAADRVVDVQHHHAHVAAVMAEHGLDGARPVIGIAFDGTGYGTAADGTTQIWGGEVLLADYAAAARVGHVRPLLLPGGDEAVRNPCRIALAYLAQLGLPVDERVPAVAACDEIERGVVARQVERRLNCVPTTSAGRLFDAVASIAGVRHRISYEAQAAIELEAAALDAEAAGRAAPDWRLVLGADGVIDPAPVLAGVVAAVLAGTDAGTIALAFHRAVARGVAEVCCQVRERTGVDSVALTGGVFQNALLVRLTRAALRDEGFGDERVITHRLVPPNDGGLSLGQAVIAGWSRRERS